MRKSQEILNKCFLEITNPYPENDLITNYQSYVNIRKNLHFYQFNPTVLDAIFELLDSNLTGTKKVSIFNLIVSIYRYSFFHHTNKTLPFAFQNTPHQLFSEKQSGILLTIYQKIEKNETPFLSQNQQIEVKKILSKFLPYLKLNDEHTEYFTSQMIDDPKIYISIIHQKHRNNLISDWVYHNFNSHNNIVYRALSTSWILDKDPTYCLSHDIMYSDFDYCNKYDEKEILQFMQNFQLQRAINNELNSIFNPNEVPYLELDTNEMPLSYKSFFSEKIIKRFYPVPKNHHALHEVDVPDYPKLVQSFNQHIDQYLNSTMLWAVAYSRLERNLKIQLLKQYYTEDNINSYITIATRYHLPEILLDL